MNESDILNELNMLDNKINEFDKIYNIIQEELTNKKQNKDFLKKVLITGTGAGLLNLIKNKIEHKQGKIKLENENITNEISNKKNELKNYIKTIKPEEFLKPDEINKGEDYIEEKRQNLIHEVDNAVDILKENQINKIPNECPQFNEIVKKQQKIKKKIEKVNNLKELKKIIKLKKKYSSLIDKEYEKILKKLNNKNKKILQYIKNHKLNLKK